MSHSTTPSAVDRAAPRSAAITGLAWLFIIASAVTLALLVLRLLSGDAPTAAFPDPATGGLPAGAEWLLARSGIFMLLLLAGSLVTLWLAIALLLRRRWARRAFLALMSCGFVATIGAAALMPLVFALQPHETGAAVVDPDAPLTGLVGMLGLLIVAATALTALFAWAGWKLTRQAVLSEFNDGPIEAETR
jgi:hypothetical protein